jgi:hypothetical protein
MASGRQPTEIFSVFGQIEAAGAEYMIGQGKAIRIPAKDVPPTVAVNDAGEPVRFAVVVPRQHLAEFERVIRDLRKGEIILAIKSVRDKPKGRQGCRGRVPRGAGTGRVDRG